MRPKIAVVGFPNAGKSTLVNRLAGGRETVVHHERGVTRDRKSVAANWNGVDFDLIDTGGVDLAEGDQLSQAVQFQARTAIEEADVALLVVDAAAGPGPGDLELAAELRKSGRPVVVAANKIDGVAAEPFAAELYRLGLGEPIPVSAAHGLGTGDLLDKVVEALKEASIETTDPAPPPQALTRQPRRAKPEELSVDEAQNAGADGDAEELLVDEAEEVLADAVPRIAIIGRPNAGKSSILNALLGSERAIVSPVAHTTRDSIDTELEHGGRRLVLVDTAGLRRRAKVAGTVGYYSQLRTESAAERADVALVICDASEGVTAEDMRVAELAMRSGCATLIVLNKWDLLEGDPEASGVGPQGERLEDARARVNAKLRLRPPLITTSAVNGRNLDKLLAAGLALADRAAMRIQTSELNRFVAEVVAERQPPQKRGKRLRLFYAAQVETRPPRFAIQVNDRGAISRDWAFFLENRLRQSYGLEGIPLVIDYIPRTRRARPDRRRSDSPQPRHRL
ncbi:MAG: ribosome biogenesis GTPase Der [Solirubrobacterales bacterium]